MAQSASSAMRAPDDEPRPPPLSDVALFVRFLRFGVMAFGGPVAQIAMIRRELVEEEHWIAPDRFNRLLAVLQVLPGPEAHELCVHLGVRARGRWGGVLAGLGFMLPGLLLMLAAAWAYAQLAMSGAVTGTLAAALAGVQAAVLAVVARAVHRIGEHILVDRWLLLTAAVAALTALAGVSFWLVLPAAGLIYVLAATRRFALAAVAALLTICLAVLMTLHQPAGPRLAPVALAAAPTALALFVAGLKGGLLTFGGAYTAIPFVRTDTVGRGWMSDAQFLDGVAIAGVLPAPLVIFATFAGWISGGPAGALAITAGMFLPAFAFSLLFYERLEQLIEHRRLQLFLNGVAAAVVGLIAVTLVQLAQGVVERAGIRAPDILSLALIFAAALVVMYRWRSKLATPAVLAAGALAGAALG